MPGGVAGVNSARPGPPALLRVGVASSDGGRMTTVSSIIGVTVVGDAATNEILLVGFLLLFALATLWHFVCLRIKQNV